MPTHRLMLATALSAYLVVGFFTSNAQADMQSQATQKLCNAIYSGANRETEGAGASPGGRSSLSRASRRASRGGAGAVRDYRPRSCPRRFESPPRSQAAWRTATRPGFRSRAAIMVNWSGIT